MSNPRKICFRVDASQAIGTGHVQRCLTLASALAAQGVDCHFICRELPGHRCDWLESKGFSVSRLPDAQPDLSNLPLHQQWLGEGLARDCQQTQAVLATQQPDWLIVDHYALDASWQKPCRQFAKHLMVIDDLADRMHDCDLLLDQNAYPDADRRYQGLVPASCQLLLGPAYALLRPEFAGEQVSEQQLLQPQSAFVFMGGADLDHATLRVLVALQMAAQFERVDVVLGALSSDAVVIELLCQEAGWQLHRNVDNMAALMARSNVAIGAGGSATWERCCVGLPSLVLELADNQTVLVEGAAALGLLCRLGRLSTLSDVELTAAIKAGLADKQRLLAIAERGRQAVLGDGVDKVVLKIIGVKN